VGLAGMWPVYRAGALGGELVFRYAGGVGTYYGDTTDVQRLVLAGLYQEAMTERAANHPDAAAAAFEQLAAKYPDDPSIQLLRAQSLVVDQHDGRAALAALARITVPADNRFFRFQYDYTKADAYVAAGAVDSARATLEALSQAFPNNPRIKQRLAQLPR
jgi:predicted Zn-dependent protease